MNSGLIILVGFVVSTILALIVWFLSKNAQRKSLIWAEIERKKAEIIALIEDAIEVHPTGTDDTNNISQGRDKHRWHTREKWLMGLSLLPLIASCVCAGVYNQSPKSPPTTTPIKLVSIAVTPLSAPSLQVGYKQQFIATATYSDSSTANINSKVTWNSSDINVATISQLSGIVTGLADGTTNITASMSGITSAAITLTVASPTTSSPTSLTPEPNAPYDLIVGSTQQFLATETYSDGSTGDITEKVTSWSSSNPNVAIISSSGLATAIEAGNTNITFIMNEIISSPVSLTVVSSTSTISTTPTNTPIKLVSIAVTPLSPPSLQVGYKQQFIATATYSHGSTADVTSQVTWASSNTAVATISSAGLAKGIAAGTANITASMDGITSRPVGLAVIATVLSSIAVTPASPPSLQVGYSQQFIATGIYSDGSTADVTSQVTWASSNTAVATISSAGLASAVAAGTVYITASVDGITSLPVDLPVIASTVITVTTTPNVPNPQIINYSMPGHGILGFSVWWINNLNAGNDIKGTVSLSGSTPALDWSNTWTFEIDDPLGNAVFSQPYTFSSGSIKTFDFTTNQGGTWKIKVSDASNYSRTLQITILPAGWH